MTKITGRIIRILDSRTAIINLGWQHNIRENSIFHILGEPEPVIDPFSNEELGRVVVVKAKLKAQQVYDKFTIATTRWTITVAKNRALESVLATLAEVLPTEQQHIDHGELRVNEDEIHPWKATSEAPVQIGDYVEVEVNSASDRDKGLAQDRDQENQEDQVEEEENSTLSNLLNNDIPE